MYRLPVCAVRTEMEAFTQNLNCFQFPSKAYTVFSLEYSKTPDHSMNEQIQSAAATCYVTKARVEIVGQYPQHHTSHS